MVLRMILVGLVAGLGLNVPAPSDFDSMAHSAQNWMNARLVEWQTLTTPADDAYVLVVEPNSTPSQSAAPAPAPAPVDDAAFATVVAETIDAFAQDQLANAKPEMDQELKSRDALMDEMSESLAIDLPTFPDPIASDDSTPEAIAQNESPIEDHAGQNAVVADATPADLDQQFAGAVEEMVADFEQSRLIAEAVEDADAVNVADADVAPNHDEIDPPATGLENQPENRLTTAVRLTREAVFAWASLLHGPAVVTMAP